MIETSDIRPGVEEELLEEMDGIFRWSIEGLKRLIKNKGFKSYPYTKQEIKKRWEKNSSSIDAFIQDEIRLTEEVNSLTKREVYGFYLEYCRREELTPENQIMFGRVFRNVTGCGVGKKQGLPAYTGVDFINSEENQQTL